MERFVLPSRRTLISGSTVSSVVARCDANNLRRVAAATVGQGVLGARPAPNWAPAPPTAPQAMPAPCHLTLTQTWRAFRKNDLLRVIVALQGPGTLTATFSLVKTGEVLGTGTHVATGSGWNARDVQISVPRRIDFAHEGDIRVALSWSGAGQWAGARVQRVSNAFETAVLEVTGGFVFCTAPGWAVAPTHRTLSAGRTSGFVPLVSGQVCLWVRLVETRGVERAVVQGLSESTSTPTEVVSSGAVQWGSEFPSGDTVQLAVVRRLES